MASFQGGSSGLPPGRQCMPVLRDQTLSDAIVVPDGSVEKCLSKLYQKAKMEVALTDGGFLSFQLSYRCSVWYM